jgi:hypothetical protein
MKFLYDLPETIGDEGGDGDGDGDGDGEDRFLLNFLILSYMNICRKYIRYSTLPNTSLFARSW